MANRYAVAAGGTWTVDATWSTTDGGAPDTVAPTASDDVFLTVNSGNVTISATSVGKSLTCTGYTGTLTHNTTIALQLYGNLTMVSGMTYSPASVSYIDFLNTATITTGTKQLRNINFNASATFTLADGLTIPSGNILTLTQGTLKTDGAADNSGLTHSWGFFNTNNTNTRTLTLGTSTINITGSGESWILQNNSASLTLNAGTSTINLINSSSSTFDGGGKTYYNVTLQNSPSYTLAWYGATFNNLSVTGSASKTAQFSLGNTGTWTINGTLSINGNSSTNRIFVHSGSLGTSRPLNAAAISISNADFRDITGAGAASWDLSAITGNSGDCGGNSGITFTTAATQTYTGGTGSWSDNTKWTSRVPLPQDNVLMSGVTGGTITADMPRLGKSIDWTGASGTPTFAMTSTSNTLYGSLTFTSSMAAITHTQTLIFEGRGAFTLTSAGKIFSPGGSGNVQINAIGGSLSLADAYSQAANSFFTIQDGTFNTNNFNMSIGRLALADTTRTRAFNLGSSILTLTGTNTGSNVIIGAPTTGLTFNAGTSTIFVSDTSATAKTLAMGGLTYNDLKIAGGGAGAIILTGSNTFNRIYTDGGGTKSITLPGSTTTTILSGQGLGNGTNVVTFTPSAGTATISKSGGGVVDWDYVHLTNIAASQTNTFYAGNSTDNGGNTNWIFGQVPLSGSLGTRLSLALSIRI